MDVGIKHMGSNGRLNQARNASTYRRTAQLTLAFFVWLPFSFTAAAVDRFIVNQPLSSNDPRYQYVYDLLEMIIDETESDFGEAIIEVSSAKMTRKRALLALQHGHILNVMAEASNPQWNEKLLPIPIPIRKGIQGFRIFLINESSQKMLADINSLSQLTALSTGSGCQWSTRTALERSGFTVICGHNYDGLFGMLAKDRFVTFSRGINEAYREINNYREQYPSLVIDKYLLLQIPLVTYFYVSPTRPELARRLKVGLQRLIENQRFDRFFYRHHCQCLLKSDLRQRQLLSISNPLWVESQAELMVEESFLFNPSMDVRAICQQVSDHK